jgi:Mg/Co/Ni transporter MgtE
VATYSLREGDLLLRRDVLDQQIVDIQDYRLVRVNDLGFTPSNGQLRLVCVDAGTRGLLRRLGLETMGSLLARLLRLTLHTHFIGWNEVEPLESSGGKIRLKVPVGKLARLHPADIAHIVNQMDPAERTEVFEALDLETAADALAEVEPEVQVSIIESLDEGLATDILEEMEPDEAADLLGDLSPEKAEDLLEDMDEEEAADVKELLAYDEETAGGLMTPEFVAVHSALTAEQVIEQIRRAGEEAEILYYLYVLDEEERLAGVFSLRELLLAASGTTVREFMDPDVIKVMTSDTLEQVAQAIAHYDLLAVPVVNEENQLQGIVTVDDVIEQMAPGDWKRRLPRAFRRRRGEPEE